VLNPRISLLAQARNESAAKKKLSKEFVQEFHDSVFNCSQKTRLQKPVEQGGSSSDESTRTGGRLDDGDLDEFRWPGIEVVMSAYSKYLKEHKLEKQVLDEQSFQLKARSTELNSSAESLSQKMAELISSKQRLEEERQRLEKCVEGLKTSLRDMR